MGPLLAPHPSALYTKKRMAYLLQKSILCCGHMTSSMPRWENERLSLLVSVLRASRVWRNQGCLRQSNRKKTSWPRTITKVTIQRAGVFPDLPYISEDLSPDPPHISEDLRKMRLIQKPDILGKTRTSGSQLHCKQGP